MKKGHLYIIVKTQDSEGNFHFYNVGDLVECTKLNRFEDYKGLPQYLTKEHIKLIGKI